MEETHLSRKADVVKQGGRCRYTPMVHDFKWHCVTGKKLKSLEIKGKNSELFHCWIRLNFIDDKPSAVKSKANKVN